jgi:hypothetical protein
VTRDNQHAAFSGSSSKQVIASATKDVGHHHVDRRPIFCRYAACVAFDAPAHRQALPRRLMLGGVLRTAQE